MTYPMNDYLDTNAVFLKVNKRIDDCRACYWFGDGTIKHCTYQNCWEPLAEDKEGNFPIPPWCMMKEK